MRYKHPSVGELVGKTLVSVVSTGDELIFKTTDGDEYKFYHEQSCCENVRIEDICGDLEDLVGSPLLMAEEVSSPEPTDYHHNDDSHTWTFYKFATVRGYVTVRWLGESNGYYSETVDLIKVCNG